MQHRIWLGLFAAAALGACNAWTGADSLELGDSHTGGGANGGAGGTTTTTNTQPTPGLVPVDGVFVDAVKLYQGVERPLMANGAPAVSSTPVVANRPALLRVFYRRDAGYNGQPVTARLTIGGGVFEQQANVPFAQSSDADLSSTINFDIAAATLATGTVYKVELLQLEGVSTGQNAAAAYPPANIVENLDVQNTGPQLRLVVVPIQYGADGSNRLPDTTESQMTRFRNLFMAMYPAAAVELTVTAPAPYNGTVDAWGNGWDSLLNWLTNRRQSSGAGPDEYWYGMFNPDTSFYSFCSQGCVAGLSNLAGPGDAWARAGIGLGFSDPETAFTAAHEVGHAHGRYHAPCGGPQGVDPSYPYSGGRDNVYGYDIVLKELHSPNDTDIMGYCSNQWISDYTFRALAQRMKTVNGAAMLLPPGWQPTPYERVVLRADGSASFESPITLDRPPAELETTVTVVVDGVEHTVQGHFVPYDHVAGGTLVVPPPSVGTLSAARFAVQGRDVVVAR